MLLGEALAAEQGAEDDAEEDLAERRSKPHREEFDRGAPQERRGKGLASVRCDVRPARAQRDGLLGEEGAVTHLVLVSDVHIDAVTSGVQRFDEVARSISETVKAAAQLKAFWCFLGDWCNPDSPRAFRSSAHAVAVAAELQRQGSKSIWLAGNHDVVEDGKGTTTLSPLREAASVFTDVTVCERPSLHVFEEERIAFWCLPYAARVGHYDADKFVRTYARSTDGYENVVLGHLTLQGIEPGSETKDMARGRDMDWPLEAIRECLPDAKVFGGHYHRRQEFAGVQIVGSIARFRHDEEGHEPGYLVWRT